ncbi:hypothetical protein [Leucobacter komagatae]|uniref:Uncharacterized protein n=1 Tax=Leucobacter komagatae TaxID=55969 RepID=A0A0D0H5A8_9MICO|nr:hypothetical protein [Leucobacter komagatae]KIP52350.1 hypothetical protein SD72_09940 [Leucobacter komagatae]
MAPGQPSGQTPWPTSPPAKKGRIGLWLALAGGAVAIIVIVALVVSFSNLIRSAADLGGALSRGGPATSAPAEPDFGDTVLGSEHPSFAAAEEFVTGTYERYAAMSEEEISEFFPHGRAGYNEDYAGAFVEFLSSQTKELRLTAVVRASEPEIATAIQDVVDGTTEFERKFLAQEFFNRKIIVQLPDGSRYSHMGEYYPQGSDAYNAEREAFATGFVPYLDANGTYVAAVNDLVGGLGMELSTSMDDFAAACPNMDQMVLQPHELAGAYCPTTPFTIYLNEQHPNHGNIIYDPYFVDLIKHEFAHARIAGTCNTINPASLPAGVNFEAATSSYAVLFFGGDRERLNAANSRSPAYLTSEASDTGARLIHEGNCG